MKKHSNPFLILYVFVLLFKLVTYWFLPAYLPVSTSLVIASLLGFYIYEVHVQSPIILLGLISGLLGDIFSLFIRGGSLYTIVFTLYFFMIMSFSFAHRLRTSQNQVKKQLFTVITGALVGLFSIYKAYTYAENINFVPLILFVLMYTLVWKSSKSDHSLVPLASLLLYAAMGGTLVHQGCIHRILTSFVMLCYGIGLYLYIEAVIQESNASTHMTK